MANAAFRSSANTANFGISSLAATKPSGVVADDGLAACLIVASSGTPPTVNSVPSGWTERGTGTGSAFGLNIRWYWYTKLAGGSEPSTYTWGLTGSTDVFTIDIHAYDNVKTAGFFGQLSALGSGTGTTMTAPAVTTNQTNQTIIAHYTWDAGGGQTGTPPAAMTERVESAPTYLADVVQAAAGTTGTKAATASASTDWLAWVLAIYGEDSSSGATVIATAAGSLSASGFAPTVLAGVIVRPGLGAVRITGFAPSIDPYTEVNTTVGGDDVLILVPTGTSNERCVMFHHGRTWDEQRPLTANFLRFAERWTTDGYHVACANLGGNTWGNDASRVITAAFHDYMESTYGITGYVVASDSMGGVSGLLSYLDGSEPLVKGWLGFDAVCDLAAIHTQYEGGEIGDEIETAYDIPGGGNYATQTSGHDPALFASSAFAAKRFRFYASTADTAVPKDEHADVVAALAVSGSALEAGVVSGTHDHGDASAIDIEDVADFLDRCFYVTTGLGAVSLSGFAPSLRLSTTTQTGLGAVQVSGFAPSVSVNVARSTGLGAVVFSGLAPSLRLTTLAQTGLGALRLTGFAPSASVSADGPVIASVTGTPGGTDALVVGGTGTITGSAL